MNFIELDSSIYALQALERAIYDLSGEIVLTIKQETGHYKIFAQNEFTYDLRDKFMQLVVDHQIRAKLDLQFADFRQKIVDRAISAAH